VEALENAVPAILIAVGVGGAIGVTGAITLGLSWRRNWTEPSALRLGVLALPVMAYTLAIPLGGNGFVAAFAAGLLFAVRGHGLPSEALQLTEDVGTLLSLCVWFVFGRAVDQLMVITVLLSVILHGLSAGPIGAAFARRAAAGRQEEASEPAAAISNVPAGK
jgi:sodium/hydrogen antiporter